VTVTSANGCTDTESITITENKTAPTAGITNNTGFTELTSTVTSISLTATGSGSYQWGNGLTSATISVSTPGNYSVTVKGANGCTSSASITISQKAPVELTVSGVVTDISCNGLTDGSIDLTVTGGKAPYIYSWYYSRRERKGVLEDISSLKSGTYTVLVKDAAGVSVSKSFTIVSPSLLVIGSEQTDISGCNSNESGSITPSASGGKAPYLFSISTGQQLADGKFIGLTAGTFTITVRDANNCVNSKSITITQTASVSFISSKVNATSCSANGSITVTASGGQSPYQYSKDGGVNWQVANNFTGLEAQSHPVVIKDNLGCISAISNVVISDNGSDVYEDNNIRRAAKTIGLESSIQARIGVSGDVDWFKNTIPQNGSGTYYLIIEAQAAGQVAQLYQGNGLLMVPNQTGSVEGSSASYGAYNLTSGKRYYIKVSGATSLACYNLKLSSSLNSNSRLLENQSEEVQTSENQDILRKVRAEDVYDVIAYPNPSDGIFKLALPGFADGEARMRIMDGMGRMIRDELGQVENGKRLGEVDLTYVAKGVYYVQVIQEGRAKTIRVILK
jgi:hypothetical protein